MPDPDRLIPFLLAVALVELTPGPNMGYLALVASRRGRAAGFATVAGVSVGLAAYLVASVVGLADLMTAWPAAYAALRWAGVVYLLWLAIDAWRGTDGVAPGAAAHNGRLFLRGLTTNLLNPKAALFYVAVLPGFIDPARGDTALQALLLGGIHLGVSVAIHSAIVLAAGGAQPTIRRWQAGRPDVVQRAMALGLVAIAAWLAVTTAR